MHDIINGDTNAMYVKGSHSHFFLSCSQYHLCFNLATPFNCTSRQVRGLAKTHENALDDFFFPAVRANVKVMRTYTL